MRRTLFATTLLAALAVVPSAHGALRTFQTPSGNIACMIVDGRSVRCDIRQKAWSPPPAPRSCEQDWGNGLSVGARGKGRIVCAGDTVLSPPGDPYRVLAYGKSIKVGVITCTSRTSGLTCRNTRGGGFALSRQSYRLF